MQSAAQLQTLIASADHSYSGNRCEYFLQAWQNQSSRTRCGFSPTNRLSSKRMARSPHFLQTSGGTFPLSRASKSETRFSSASTLSGNGASLFQNGKRSRSFAMSSMAPISTIPPRFGERPLDIHDRGVAKLILVENSISVSAATINPKDVTVLIQEAGVHTRIHLSKSEALHFAQCIVNEANRVL